MSLWKPDTETRQKLATGDRKYKLGWMKNYYKLTLAECPYCGRYTYFIKEKNKYLTEGGSEHKCKNMHKRN